MFRNKINVANHKTISCNFSVSVNTVSQKLFKIYRQMPNSPLKYKAG